MSSMIFTSFLNSLTSASDSVDMKMSRVTIAVDGMMKSKSGATWLSWPDSVSAALSELAGVKNVEVFLETDEFTVTYDGDLVTTEQMKNAISALEYEPKIVRSRLVASVNNSYKGAIPEPVAAAIAHAGGEGKLVFVDFYAEWCGACKILDSTTLKNPSVVQTLQQFVFLKVDADQYPDAITHFNIVGMPTLLVLNLRGEEVYRQVGPIKADKLTGDLSALAQ